MKFWHQALLGLIALTLAPTLYAANPCESGGSPVMHDGTGAGGTGLRPDTVDGTGQGGTGLIPHKKSGGDGSGSGGTGHTVEVEGVITGFASICVNGLELQYSPDTPVTIQGKTGSSKDLNVGQVVRALAKGRGNQLTLQRIHVRHLLVSKLEGLDLGKLRAQGRNISLSPHAVLPSSLVPGVKVAVSGFVGAHGQAVATRLDVVPNDTPDSLTGEVQRNAQGELTVDGVALKGRLAKLEPGDLIRAEGHYEHGRMQVTRFEREERAMLVDRVVMQGLVSRANKSGIRINGQRFLLDSKTRMQAPPRVGEWAIVDAVRAGGQFRAREIDDRVLPGNGMDKPSQKGGYSPLPAGQEEKTFKQERNSGTPPDHADQGAEQPEKTESIKSPESPEKSSEAEKIERSEKSERPEKIVKPETIERLEKVERPEKVERVEKIERPEKVERPEKIERPEKVERPERVERVERPEHDD